MLSRKSNKKSLCFGEEMEKLASQYLQITKGWRVLGERLHFREGELDLIMETPEGELRFVEVKGRRNEYFGAVVESLTTGKIQRLKRASYRWRMSTGNKQKGQFYFVGILMDPENQITMEEHFIE